jgi:hypothetical protein
MLESSPQNKYSRRLYRDSSRCGPRFRLRWLFRNGIVFLRFGVCSMAGKYESLVPCGHIRRANFSLVVAWELTR